MIIAGLAPPSAPLKPAVKAGANSSVDWSLLVAPLINPIKVIIIEAMLWIERPLSATELRHMLFGAYDVPSCSYHLNSLAELKVLEQVTRRRVKKSSRAQFEIFFYFAKQNEWAIAVAHRRDLSDHLTNVAMKRVSLCAGQDADAPARCL